MMTYYRQSDPLSIRRYDKDLCERWDNGTKKWVKQCAPEQCCIRTEDKIISEEQALLEIEFI